MVAIRNRALTTQRPRALTIRPPTQRRERIPLRAAVIPLRLAPIRHPAAAIAVAEEAAARTAVEAVELPTAVEAVELPTAVEVAALPTAVEAPVLTATNNLLPGTKGPPAKLGRAFSFSAHLTRFRQLASSRAHNSSSPQVLYEVKHFVTGICCFDMGKMRGKCSLTMKCYCLKWTR